MDLAWVWCGMAGMAGMWLTRHGGHARSLDGVYLGRWEGCCAGFWGGRFWGRVFLLQMTTYLESYSGRMAFGCGVLDGRARCDLSWCCRSDPDKVRIWTNTLHHSNQIRPAVRPQQERQPAERENLVAGLSDPASPVAGVGAPPSQHLQ